MPSGKGMQFLTNDNFDRKDFRNLTGCLVCEDSSWDPSFITRVPFFKDL